MFHHMNSGRSVTGILHLVNKAPIDWFTKKHATVETAMVQNSRLLGNVPNKLLIFALL